MARTNAGKGREKQKIKNNLSDGNHNRNNHNNKKTYEIANEKFNSDGTINFFHIDEKKMFINVPICSICGGHEARGSMTMRECEHNSLKTYLQPF